MLTSIAVALLISAAVSLLMGALLIPLLRRLKAGQTIKDIGPVWHISKQGTPTMGGLMFIAGITVAVIVFTAKDIIKGELAHLAMLAFALLYGAIGFLDDYEKVRKRGNTGLSALQKFALQLIVAISFLLLLRRMGYITPNLYIPFWNVSVPMPEVLYFVIAAFAVVGIVNGANLTDGVDGLLTGVSLPMAIFFAFAAYKWDMRIQGVYAGALAGGLAAFLVYNFHPAKIFMGDTGSLFIGGSICALALSMDMLLVLIPVGMIYMVTVLSDIIQVSYFKASHGKRIFKMAPLHHHFEKSGWSEVKIFVVYTSFSVLFALIAWMSVMGRFRI